MTKYAHGFFFLFLIGFCFTSCNQPGNNQLKTDYLPVLLSDSSREASCVYLTKDADNIPVISWIEIDTAKHKKYFYFSRWNTKNGRFEGKHPIPIPVNTSIHEEGMPKIAFSTDNRMVALFETATPPSEKHPWG